MQKADREDSSEGHSLALSEAIAEQRLMLYYQPIVRMATGRVMHYEALLRLRDREGRVVAPGQFLSIVQELGLTGSYTEWVIQEAVQALRARPGVKVHVNLFSECIGRPDLVDFISDQVRDLDPGRLGFEMAEDTVIADISNVARWITAIKNLGCKFAIDDFGAGNTATVALVSLPVDCVKIDGSLVTGLIGDPNKRSLVQAVNRMASGQKKGVIAEWVESEAIASELIDIGIRDGQGYYFGAPNPRLPRRMGRRRAVASSGRAAT